MTLQLKKALPARTVIERFKQCALDWTKYDSSFRKAREHMPKKLNACYWCTHKFVDGEMISLAFPEKGTNKVLCGDCAKKLLSTNDKASI